MTSLPSRKHAHYVPLRRCVTAPADFVGAAGLQCFPTCGGGGRRCMRECAHARLRLCVRLTTDVGCGIGGSAMALRTKFGCRVTGIDVTSNAIAIAKERLEENGETANGQDQLKFEVMDVFKAPYEENSFDLIYSKDAILYIPNKDTLFRLFHKWLKPGGQVTGCCRIFASSRICSFLLI
eukprot:GHVU01147762.1.p2 GENE.GHVU01147762.1~~GHVU01147762.1.p2  ORF type:complete len:180 (+),score=18.43 GHVU01147762.1:1285-1824(+)